MASLTTKLSGKRARPASGRSWAWNSLLAKPYIITFASPKEVCSFKGNSDPTWVWCKFGGSPEPFVTMRFKGKLVSNATTVAEKKLITDALKHFGVYKGHAENEFGSTNYSIELKLTSEKYSLLPVTSQFWRLQRVLTIHIEWETTEHNFFYF